MNSWVRERRARLPMIALVMALLATMLATVAGVGAATAQEVPEDSVRIFNLFRGQVLDEVGNNVVTSPEDNTIAADWSILDQGDGTVLIQNLLTGRYLDSDPNRNVDTSSNPSVDDIWEIEELGDGIVAIRNVNYNRYLDADGANAGFDVDITSSSVGQDDTWVIRPNQPALPTIAEIATGNQDFSTLVAALSAASDVEDGVPFLDIVSDPEADVTVFAPTNAAFASLPEGVLEAALADPGGLLTNVLLYHVLDGSRDAASLLEAGGATTLLGEDITVTINDDGMAVVNGTVGLIATDIAASNGVVHVIDAVLLPPAPPELPTIAEIATGNQDFSTLVAALTAASENGPVDFLTAVSDPEEDLTVFAPTNAAFDALPEGVLAAALADPAGLLTDVLLYHVLEGGQLAGELLGAGGATTLLGEDITVTINDGVAVVNGNVELLLTDIEAANGVVHVIDAVLLPPEPLPTIAEIALGNEDFSTLVAALGEASLVEDGVPFLDIVSDPEADVTVFAPTNAAFASLPEGVLEAALADPGGLLTNVLLYHVLDGSRDAASLLEAGGATTLLGEDITVTINDDGMAVVNGTVGLIATDIAASNGVVHVIDAVLLPPAPPELPTIAEIAFGDENFSTLVAALVAASDVEGGVPFTGIVSDPEADVTVFAPTNAAFASLPEGVLEEALADPGGLLTNVLLYHVLDGSQDAASLLAAGGATTLLGEDITVTINDDGMAVVNGTVGLIATDIAASNGIVHVIDAVLLPAAPPVNELPVADGDVIYLRSAVDGRYLDGDTGNVDLSNSPRADDEWVVNVVGENTITLFNPVRNGYLDADGPGANFNVELSSNPSLDDEWIVIPLEGGNYLLQNAELGRYLDADANNVETSANPAADDEWFFELVAEPRAH